MGSGQRREGGGWGRRERAGRRGREGEEEEDAAHVSVITASSSLATEQFTSPCFHKAGRDNRAVASPQHSSCSTVSWKQCKYA